MIGPLTGKGPAVKKNVWKSDRRWEPGKFENFENIKNDLWDMLNNFCFHVYAQKSLFKAENVMVFIWHQWFCFDKTLWTAAAPFPVFFRS